MVTKILGLLGLAPTEEQASIPPLFAYLLVVVAGYFSAEIIESIVWVASHVGVVGRYLSVAFRTVGVVATLFLAHGLYRILVHRDTHSWAGYLKAILLRP